MLIHIYASFEIMNPILINKIITNLTKMIDLQPFKRMISIKA